MSRPIASPGSMTVDWEERVNPERLRTYRFERARQALEASDLGALLVFDFNNIRYVTSTHIGEWARDKMTRFALLTRGGEPHLWDFGSAAKHHRLNCPWLLPENIRGGMIGLRGAVAPDAGLFDRRGARDRRHPEGRGRGRHAGRRRPGRAADAGRAREGRDHRARRAADDARRARGQVGRRDHAAEHRLRHGRRRLPAHRRAAQAGRPREPARGRGHEGAVRHGLASTSTTSMRSRASAARPHPHVFSDRLIRPGDQAFFDIIQTFVGYKTCYYRTFVVGHGQRRATRRVQAGAGVDRRLDRADEAGRDDRPGRIGLAEGGGVRVRLRDGVLRAPVRPRRRALPPRAADHQPAQLARAPDRAEGGHGHRARDVLPGHGRLLGGADRGGGGRHGRGPAGHHPLPVARSCSWRIPY